MPPRDRHRHFLVAPVFLALLALSLAGDRMNNVRSYSPAPGIVRLPGGGGVRLRNAVRMDLHTAPALLTEGDLTVVSRGIARIRTDRFLLTGLAGAWQVHANVQRVTVSALESPVLVEGGGEKMLVPVGYRWESQRGLPPLTQGLEPWLAARSIRRMSPEEMAAVREANPPSEFRVPQSRGIADLFRAVQFPAALSRNAEVAEDASLQNLAGSLERGDDEEALRIFLEISQTAPKEKFFPFLWDLPNPSPLRSAFVSLLSEDSAQWMIAAVHPRLRGTLWALPTAELSREDRLLLLFLLPQANIDDAGLPRPALRMWENEAQTLLQEAKDPRELAEKLVRFFAPFAVSLEKLGYPERAQVLLTAISGAVDRSGTELSAGAQTKLTAAWTELSTKVPVEVAM